MRLPNSSRQTGLSSRIQGGRSVGGFQQAAIGPSTVDIGKNSCAPNRMVIIDGSRMVGESNGRRISRMIPSGSPSMRAASM